MQTPVTQRIKSADRLKPLNNTKSKNGLSEPKVIPPKTTGQQLAQAREELGLSVQDIAEKMLLSDTVILALENHEYDSLNGKAYVTGYVRSYASLVNLDADALIAADPDLGVVAVFEDANDSAHSGSSTISMRELASLNWRLIWATILFLITFVTIATIAWQNRDSFGLWWSDSTPEQTPPNSQSLESPLYNDTQVGADQIVG